MRKRLSQDGVEVCMKRFLKERHAFAIDYENPAALKAHEFMIQGIRRYLNTKNQAVDPLAFHMAIVFALMLAAYGLLYVLHWITQQVSILSSFRNLNIMVPALVVSLVFGMIASKTKLGQICDKDSLSRVGGTSLEFLIASSVATTNLDLVMTYGKPILLISVMGLSLTALFCLGLSKLWLRKNWFEHGILMMGAYTGVLATGLMLLRIADPEMETDALIDVVTASPVWTLTSQNLYLAIVPMMLVTAAGYQQTVFISAALIVGVLIFGFFFYRKD